LSAATTPSAPTQQPLEVVASNSRVSKIKHALEAVPAIRAGLRELTPENDRKSLTDFLQELSDDILAARAQGRSDAAIARFIASQIDYGYESVVRTLRLRFGSNGRGKKRVKKGKES
jgi:hypothetical protein